MGLKMGQLWKYYGLVTYRISPFEQKPLKGVLNPGFFNVCKRFAEQVPYIGPRKLSPTIIIIIFILFYLYSVQ